MLKVHLISSHHAGVTSFACLLFQPLDIMRRHATATGAGFEGGNGMGGATAALGYEPLHGSGREGKQEAFVAFPKRVLRFEVSGW